ncbi:hypothetical protein CLOP_g15740 [Closterium sp. NIES-67]|nr:hypothetical protein CLOP_g15740 [Closterium sp. NIES-67]
MNPAASHHQSSRSLGASAAPLYPSAASFPAASAPPPSSASSTLSYPALPSSHARFPPSSPSSADPYSSAPLRFPPRRSPSSVTASASSSASMSLVWNLSRGICASCLAASLFAALVCTSLPFAMLLVWRLAPNPFDQTRLLLFDFRQPEPYAVASFLPRPHTLLPPPPDPPHSPGSSSARAGAQPGRFFSAAPPRLLQRGQRYEAVLRLRLPESDHNLALGMFQVSAHALSADHSILSANSQPATLKFRSRPIRALRTALLAVPFFLGFREEAQRLELRVLRGVEGKAPVAAVRVMLEPKAGAGSGAGLPQIYEAELRLRAVLGGAGGLWLLAWRVMLFAVCAAAIFGVQAMVLLVCCGGVMVRLLWQGGNKERESERALGRMGSVGSMGEVAGREGRGMREDSRERDSAGSISGVSPYALAFSSRPSAPLPPSHIAPAASSASAAGFPPGAASASSAPLDASEEVLRPVFMQGGERGRGKGKAEEVDEGERAGMDSLRDEGAIAGRVRAWMGEGSGSSSSSSLGIGSSTPVATGPAAPAALRIPLHPPSVGLAPSAAPPLGRPLGGDERGVGREAEEEGVEGVEGVRVGEGEEEGSDEEIESLLAAGKELLRDRSRQVPGGEQMATWQEGGGEEEGGEGEEGGEEEGEGSEVWRPGLRQRRAGVGRVEGQSLLEAPSAPLGMPSAPLGQQSVPAAMGRQGVAEAVQVSQAAADAAFRSAVVAAGAVAGERGGDLRGEGGVGDLGGGGRGGGEEWEEAEGSEGEEEERRYEEVGEGEGEEEEGGESGEFEDVWEGGSGGEEEEGEEEDRMVGGVDAAAAAATVAMVGLGQERKQKQGEREKDKGESVWVLGAGAAEWDEGESEHGERGADKQRETDK